MYLKSKAGDHADNAAWPPDEGTCIRAKIECHLLSAALSGDCL